MKFSEVSRDIQGYRNNSTLWRSAVEKLVAAEAVKFSVINTVRANIIVIMCPQLALNMSHTRQIHNVTLYLRPILILMYRRLLLNARYAFLRIAN
jgi:hypothetical protein